MADTCLLDTTILLNILNVPGRNQDKDKVRADFQTYINAECLFIIPYVVAVEVGNHISQKGDGRVRRERASQFVNMMRSAFNNETPFKISSFDLKKEWQTWIDEFVDSAGQNKTPDKPNEGMSLTDLSIIKEYEALQAKNKANRNKRDTVFIWSLDSDLEAYGRSH